jgi:sterol desaturase/sphingolipid hydroxylase (fatty acid hydroxylase superfamily)
MVGVGVCCWVSASWWPAIFCFVLALSLCKVHAIGHTHEHIPGWYMAHTLGHHGSAYPTTRFTSRVYVPNVLDPRQLNTFMYIIAGLFVWFVLAVYTVWAFSSPRIPCVTFVYAAMLGIVDSCIHEQFHLDAPWLERFRWFKALRRLHWFHHRGKMNVNFAITTWFIDVLCGTFKSCELNVKK